VQISIWSRNQDKKSRNTPLDTAINARPLASEPARMDKNTFQGEVQFLNKNDCAFSLVILAVRLTPGQTEI